MFRVNYKLYPCHSITEWSEGESVTNFILISQLQLKLLTTINCLVNNPVLRFTVNIIIHYDSQPYVLTY